MWRKLTIEDLASTLSRKEMESFAQSSSLTGADPIKALVDRTAALVRSYCRANKTIAISPIDGEIPESLISPAADYAAYDVLKRLPVAVGEDRRRARDAAQSLFEKVARSEVIPESYGDDESQSISATPSTIPPSPPRLLD